MALGQKLVRFLGSLLGVFGVAFIYDDSVAIENAGTIYPVSASVVGFKVGGTTYVKLSSAGIGVDNLVEYTAANGIAIDGARIKDGLVYETTSTVAVGTVANGGTVAAAQIAGKLLYQDASGGAVTMTTRTGTQMTADFPNVAVGQTLEIGVASNHATNTSTLAGGTDVTLTGDGAVTKSGGKFWLTKLTATTWQLARVG